MVDPGLREDFDTINGITGDTQTLITEFQDKFPIFDTSLMGFDL